MSEAKNKIIGIVSAAALVAVAVAAGTYPSWKPVSSVTGEYTGTAKGMGGNVTVTLEITDNVITNVTAEGKGETPSIGTKALEELPKEMVQKNAVQVDGVTGATITSDAIKKAGEQALTKAGLTDKDLSKK